MRWVAFAALAWVATIALFAIAVQSPARPPQLSHSDSTSHLARTLSAVGTTGDRNPAWVVIKASSARHALVVEVEARVPEHSARIADEIVRPVHANYEEILIYVRPAGSPAGALVRRIQWTPRGGFVESAF